MCGKFVPQTKSIGFFKGRVERCFSLLSVQWPEGGLPRTIFSDFIALWRSATPALLATRARLLMGVPCVDCMYPLVLAKQWESVCVWLGAHSRLQQCSRIVPFLCMHAGLRLETEECHHHGHLPAPARTKKVITTNGCRP